ncbi:MAG: PP2C family protein-serine/threonine phosphatase [Phycisphaerae bacterium]
MVSDPPRILLLGPAHERSRDVCERLQERGLPQNSLVIEPSPTHRALQGADVLVCVLDPKNTDADTDRLAALLARAQAAHVAALVWGVPDNFKQPEGELTECLSANVGLDEVVSRLTALARYAPVVKRMEKELQGLQRLGRHLNRYFEEIDHELRLAGRLQHDFLPHELPQLPSLKFAQLYRPAGWVSGDIFDVFRVDQHHVGLFIADAMGHGTAAGLMTMFLRRALVPKQGRGDSERIVAPAEAMRLLHEELARQDLPHAQFVTSVYAILDVESLEIRLARGGHPYPLHLNAAGEIREMCCEGGLLGVAGLEPEFAEHHNRLVPGDKVIFYTDGLEELFIAGRDRHSEQAEYTEHLLRWAPLDADSFVTAIGDYLDQQEGSLNPADDVTVVVAEVAN